MNLIKLNEIEKFKNFIKEHVIIDLEEKFIDFIDDFYNIANTVFYDNNKIIIDLDIVVNWLDVEKRYLIKRIKKNTDFIENIDYIITRKQTINVNKKGNYYDEIFITVDCFRYLCFTSTTEKGNMCRKYYGKLENLIIKYYDIIQEKMQEEIKTLKYNQSSKLNIKGGVIYIRPVPDDDEMLKPGITNNMQARSSTYNTGNANDIEPLFVLHVDNPIQVERCMKNLIMETQYRNGKEIYKIKLEKLIDAITTCDKMIISFNKEQTDKNKLLNIFKELDKDGKEYYLSIEATNKMEIPEEIAINSQENLKTKLESETKINLEEPKLNLEESKTNSEEPKTNSEEPKTNSKESKTNQEKPKPKSKKSKTKKSISKKQTPSQTGGNILSLTEDEKKFCESCKEIDSSININDLKTEEDIRLDNYYKNVKGIKEGYPWAGMTHNSELY